MAPKIGDKANIAGKAHVYGTNRAGVKGYYLAPKGTKATDSKATGSKAGGPKVGDKATIAGKAHVYGTNSAGVTGYHLAKKAPPVRGAGPSSTKVHSAGPSSTKAVVKNPVINPYKGTRATNKAAGAKVSMTLKERVAAANKKNTAMKKAGIFMGR